MENTPFQAVVIGASAGALEALSRILPQLPGNFPLPVMVVVHVPPDKDSVIADIFASKCNMGVKEAEDKEILEPGIIYFAPPDYHLQVEANHSLSLSSDEEVLFSRPSIDVLFETAAETYRDTLIGIVLTGANNDGAHGLKAIAKAGGTALVQDPQTAQASAMPLEAIKACPSANVLTLEGIAEYLKEIAA